DAIDIRLGADGQPAAVVKADHIGWLTGQRCNGRFNRDTLLLPCFGCPAFEEESRETGVADHAIMRSAIGQPHDRAGMRQHAMHRVKISVTVIGAWLVEYRLSILLQ